MQGGQIEMKRREWGKEGGGTVAKGENRVKRKSDAGNVVDRGKGGYRHLLTDERNKHEKEKKVGGGQGDVRKGQVIRNDA